MAPKTYTNDHGEKMHMKYRQILTIDHDDIGMVYFMPDGRFYTLDSSPIGEGLKHPETDEILMMTNYTPVILSEEERILIRQHINGE
jgi:hypothetical protein